MYQLQIRFPISSSVRCIALSLITHNLLVLEPDHRIQGPGSATNNLPQNLELNKAGLYLLHILAGANPVATVTPIEQLNMFL